MNFKQIFEKSKYHLLIIIAFVAVSYIYFSPLLEGKVLSQMDDIHAKGMAKELVDYKAQTGEDSQWTNSMFSGMPAYQIKAGTQYNVFLYLVRALRLGLPYSTVAVTFLYLLGFYVLFLSLKFDKWLAVAASVAFAFASYNFIIIAAGHITKTWAIGYMAPVIAGVIMLYNGKYLWGALLTVLALGMEIASNHVQITYYLALIVLIMSIVYFIDAILQKQIKEFSKSAAVLFVAAILAVLPNITQLWTTYEYGQESIRGASELTSKNDKKSSGLDKDYALAWSYGKWETLTLLIPDFQGGSSSVGFDKNSNTYEVLQGKVQNPEQIANSLAYWGDMPFTSGPVYFGAIVILLFVLSLFVLKGKNKWWLVAATVLSILLAWGKNLEWFTDFFFYYVPLYSKFRTVSMALVITNVTVVILAFMGIKAIYESKKTSRELSKYLYTATGIVGGICLIFMALPTMFFDFTSANFADFPDWLQKAVVADRISLLQKDAFRSLIFVLLGSGLMWLLINKKLNKSYFTGILIALLLLDLWSVDKRYLNNDSFVSKRQAHFFQPTNADKIILKDVDPHFRVFNITRNPFNDAYTSYYHKSIGGYHGAKLRRYQDLIEHHIAKNNMNVLNMLNAKYFITPNKKTGEPVVEYNFLQALGNSWFVNEYQIVSNADEELAALNTFNPAKTAIIDKRFTEVIKKLPKLDFFSLDTGRIALTKYAPNRLEYNSKNQNTQLAVFSEIYYDKGWQAYIDDQPVEHIRVNYVLRALPIPKGQHKIVFEFKPRSYYVGNKVALGSSILVVLLILGTFVKQWKSLG